ncbi:DNA/RNA helicase domain-containing protein [Nesterenkonia populi]
MADSPTTVDIISFNFTQEAEKELSSQGQRLRNWPAVYLLRNEQNRTIYVGESTNVARRISQHHANRDKTRLRALSGSTARGSRVILDDEFNKSAALDLEAFLIQHLAGDGKYQLLNRNDGIVDRDYFGRIDYRARFRTTLFEQLRQQRIFQQKIEDIENDDLFKLSPFKSLEDNQERAVQDIVSLLLKSLKGGSPMGSIAVEGDPGTGKTIVAVFLLKLLVDIGTAAETEQIHDEERESEFPEFFTPENRRAVKSLLETANGIALVVPQQSLRESIQRVFRRIPNLSPDMVVNPFRVGNSDKRYSMIIVDETHRLSQKAAQASGPLNGTYRDINERLFGHEPDGEFKTQLDWIQRQSDHQILLIDLSQSVHASDLPKTYLQSVIARAEREGKHHRLRSQMRVLGGNDYIKYIKSLVGGTPPTEAKSFGSDYEFRMFEDVAEMHRTIRERNSEFGLARMAAGYAWEWVSRKDPSLTDIRIGDFEARWNSQVKDWVDSPGSIDEVGSIHTLQGYDLNYAGIIVGPDLRYDPDEQELWFDRKSFFDKRAIYRNKHKGRDWTHEELLEWVRNIYYVLLTRGRRGTFMYVCDEYLRDYLRPYVPDFEWSEHHVTYSRDGMRH